MLVKRLDAVVYTDGGRSRRVESAVSPSWSLVEQSIRRLDKFAYPFLHLSVRETRNDEDDRLEIMGGEGDYWVAGTFDGYVQRRLVNPDGGGANEIRVWTSGQGFGDAARYVCHDVEVVVRVARYFLDHRAFDPSVVWEDQPRRQRRSAPSRAFRALIGRVRRTPPTCIANAAPRLDPGPKRPPDEQFGTTFSLGCPCGSRETAVLCHPTKVGSEILILSPLALQCSACSRVIEIFDSDLHGYDPEVCGESATMRGSGERQLYRCSACGHSVGEAAATFSFNDPQGLQDLPQELAGREQDTFDWFALEWRCAACGEEDSVADYERA